jgi:hypothetical protein
MSGLERCPACHPEHIRFAQCKLREGSGSPDEEILRCAQDDRHSLQMSKRTAPLFILVYSMISLLHKNGGKISL